MFPNIFARGKLLLTGEYAVLSGAQALAFPARKGQSLKVSPSSKSNQLQWYSADVEGTWFSATFSLIPLEILETTDITIANRLLQILKTSQELREGFLNSPQGLQVETLSDFPRGWGLGTSSTLIYLLASWARIDPFLLLENTLGGSGYDVACAGSNGPILYRLTDDGPVFEPVSFNPPFLDSLYLVYSGKKMSTETELKRFDQLRKNIPVACIDAISNISREVLLSDKLNTFCDLLAEHEDIISDLIQQTSVQSTHYRDFKGLIKSLGAWGGDFLLFATSEGDDYLRGYLRSKDLSMVIPFDELLITH